MAYQQQPRWLLDSSAQQWYYYDGRTDSLVYQSGVRVPRPQQIPRAFLEQYSLQPAAAQPGPAHTRNLSDQESQYTYRAEASGPQPRQTLAAPYNIAALTENVSNLAVQSPPVPQPVPKSHASGPVTPEVFAQNGQRVISTMDPTTEVRTRYQTEPVEQITDPRLFRYGIRATRSLLETGGDSKERLFDGYRKRSQPRKFFTVGKVFIVLWVEPAGGSLVTSYERGTSLGKFGELVFSKVRRFVVIREADNYCSALPIASYSKQGVSKLGVKKSEHCIIHSTKDPPSPLPLELAKRGEEGMRPLPIKVDVDDLTETLDDFSRLNFG